MGRKNSCLHKQVCFEKLDRGCDVCEIYEKAYVPSSQWTVRERELLDTGLYLLDKQIISGDLDSNVAEDFKSDSGLPTEEEIFQLRRKLIWLKTMASKEGSDEMSEM